MTIDKKSLSRRDVCTKFITPALRKAGWDEMAQIREEVSFTKGRIIVHGKLVSRGKGKGAGLLFSPSQPPSEHTPSKAHLYPHVLPTSLTVYE